MYQLKVGGMKKKHYRNGVASMRQEEATGNIKMNALHL